MAQKLFEISGEDWMKGMSFQRFSHIGGIFQTASNFDPFEQMGLMKPARGATVRGSTEVTVTPRWMVPFVSTTIPSYYVYAGPVASNGTLALYSIRTDTGAVTDVSAEVTVTSSRCRGAITWAKKTASAQRFIYARDTELRSNSIPVASANDTAILSSGVNSGEHKFEVGADLNLYFTNGQSVGKIVEETTTTNNTGDVMKLEYGMTIRDIINDGRYLVILADNGTDTSNGTARFKCVVAFWDYTSSTFTQRFDFLDGGLIAGGLLDDGIYIIGKDNIYVTNVATKPQPVFSFRGNSTVALKPSSPSQVVIKNNSICWGDSTGQQIFAYGNPIPGGRKIIYQPNSAVLGNITALAHDGTSFWSGTDNPKLYQHSSSTLQDTNTTLSQINFQNPYIFEFAKIVLSRPISGSQSLTLSANAQQGDGNITASSTFNTTDKQTKIIYPLFTGATHRQYFEEISNFTITTTGGPVIERIEVWGEPQHVKSDAI